MRSGDIVTARDVDYPYEIRLSCINAAPGAESRQHLQNAIDTANRKILVRSISPLAGSGKDGAERISAEIFVDLGDGPQSLSEAQLFAGMAKLDEKTSAQSCPMLDAMKKAQAEAKESKLGVWAK